MTPLRRLGDFFGGKTNDVSEDANATTGVAGTRIVAETIESRFIDAGGVGYSIRGKLVKSSGITIFQVGELVNVLFKGDEPVVILGHSWRKAQFEEKPPIVIGVGLLEIVDLASIKLPDKIDPETGDPIPQSTTRFVIFTGKGQFALDPEFPGLNPPPELDEEGNQVDPEAPPEDVIKLLQIAWGENSNHLLLRFEIPTPTFGNPFITVEFLQAFKINRNVDSTNVPLKKDPADETKTLKVGDVPVVDGELVGNRIALVQRDLLLRRDVFGVIEIQLLKAKENIIFRTFHDIEAFNEAKTEGAEVGGPETALKELPGFWDSRTTEVATVAQEHKMTLGGVDSEDPDLLIGRGAYSTGFGPIASFLDGQNEIIQIYNISWSIGRFFSAIPENTKRVTLFAPSPGGPMPTVTELLTAAGFLNPVPPGAPLDLPDLRQGATILQIGSLGIRAPHTEGIDFNLESIVFEPFAFLQIIPEVSFLARPDGVAIGAVHFDVFALKRDTTSQVIRVGDPLTGNEGEVFDPTKDKSVIVGASFEEEVELEYDRTVDLPMFASLFQTPDPPPPDQEFDPIDHLDLLQMTRPAFGVSQAPGATSFVDDGTGQANLLNFRGATQSGGNGPFYFTDEFGGGCCPGPITKGADGFLDQIGKCDPSQAPPPFLTLCFPQAFATTFDTVRNVKFRGRLKFGDPELRPELPDIVKETQTTRTAFNALSTRGSSLFQPGEITTPGSSIDIENTVLTFFEEHDPSFGGFGSGGGGFDPLLNKGAFLIVGTSLFGEETLVVLDLPVKRRILRWDYANPDETIADFPTQPFELRGPGDFFANTVDRLFAHDGSIYLRWTATFPGFDEHIFIPAKAGEPESVGDRLFRGGKAPRDVLDGGGFGFTFIKPGRGKPGQVQQSYSNNGGDPKTRDRIYRITIDELGLAQIEQTTAPPNVDLRRINPKVVPAGGLANLPSYHFAGIK